MKATDSNQTGPARLGRLVAVLSSLQHRFASQCLKTELHDHNSSASLEGKEDGLEQGLL